MSVPMATVLLAVKSMSPSTPTVVVLSAAMVMSPSSASMVTSPDPETVMSALWPWETLPPASRSTEPSAPIDTAVSCPRLRSPAMAPMVMSPEPVMDTAASCCRERSVPAERPILPSVLTAMSASACRVTAVPAVKFTSPACAVAAVAAAMSMPPSVAVYVISPAPLAETSAFWSMESAADRVMEPVAPLEVMSALTVMSSSESLAPAVKVMSPSPELVTTSSMVSGLRAVTAIPLPVACRPVSAGLPRFGVTPPMTRPPSKSVT